MIFTETPMTARELIEQLSQYPPDSIVLYRRCSTITPLEKGEVSFIGKDGMMGNGPNAKRYWLICHKDTYMHVEEGWQEKGQEEPALNAVLFPGN